MISSSEDRIVTDDSPKLCPNCSGALSPTAKFCSKCGKPVQQAGSSGNFKKDLNSFLFSCMLIVGYILGTHIVKIGGGTFVNLFFDVVFLIVVLLTLYINRRNNPGIFSWKGFRFSSAFMYLGIQLVITILVILASDKLGAIFHLEDERFLDGFSDSSIPLFFASVSIAVFPAITEEIAFRSILFNSVTKLSSPVSAIFVTGVIFGFVHFNFLSILWLIPAGLYLGWIRYREGTIWYGVLCHFQHNLIVLLLNYFHFY